MTQRKDPRRRAPRRNPRMGERRPETNKVMRGFIFKFIHQARSLECVDFVEAYAVGRGVRFLPAAFPPRAT